MATRFVTFQCDGIEVEMTGDYEPGYRGRYSGPPEDCYPDEPARFESETVMLTLPTTDGDDVQVDAFALPRTILADKWVAILEQLACETLEKAAAQAEQEDRRDALREEMEERIADLNADQRFD